MNEYLEEITYLQKQINALNKKLRDRYHDFVRIMDTAQYEHSFEDKVYLELKEVVEDPTRWNI